jgi:thiol-disulfide isomerase/thioredoxin
MKKITNRSDFDSELKAGDRLALFYSAYCPFCISFLPAFEKLAKTAPGGCVAVCTDDLDELEDLFAVDVVPTALYFKAGKLAARLDGVLGRGLTEAGLAEFMKTCGCAK